MENGTVKNSNTKTSQLMMLFEDQLKDIYWAEKALIKAMPKMIENASCDDLIDELKSHHTETEKQVIRAEEVFKSIDTKVKAKKCEAMDGLIKEAEEIIASCEPGAMYDAGIIVAAQKIEHYEISTYGNLCVFADTLGEDRAYGLLKQTLDEEKEADKKLSKIAESINNKAANARQSK